MPYLCHREAGTLPTQHLKQMTLQSPSEQLKAGKILKAIANTGKWQTWEYIPEDNEVFMTEGWSDEPGCRSKVVNWFMGTCNLVALKKSDLWKTNF